MNYVTLLERKKSELEAQYARNICRNSMASAYDTLGSMMAYKCIDKNDDRVSTKQFNMFKKAGIDVRTHFELDYRKGFNFAPKWVYADLPARVRLELLSERHWGKRVEGGYEGDVVFPERYISFVVKACNEYANIKTAFEYMQTIYTRELGKRAALNIEDFLSGEFRLLTVDVAAEEVIQHKNFGVIVLKHEDGECKVILALENTLLDKSFMDIGNAYKTIGNMLKSYMVRLGTAEDSIKLTAFCNIKEVYKEQLKKKRDRIIVEKKLDKIREENLKQS